jgi:hypothetical protein
MQTATWLELRLLPNGTKISILLSAHTQVTSTLQMCDSNSDRNEESSSNKNPRSSPTASVRLESSHTFIHLVWSLVFSYLELGGILKAQINARKILLGNKPE